MNDVASTTRKITLTATDDFLGPHSFDPARQAARRFALIVFCDGEAHLREVDEGASVVVGRHAPAEVVVDDVSVSRQHARVSREGDRIWIEDLESRNGTLIRGARIRRQPFEAGEQATVGRARLLLAATRVVDPRSSEATTAESEGPLIVENARMKQIFRDVARAARTDLPVLVLGETGTGKEHVARAVHTSGDRRDKPFVVVNCSAIPAPLLEATLFGHERGAFTGAVARTPGFFERANGGVLFLDEIGELTSSAQVRSELGERGTRNRPLALSDQ